MMFFGFAGAAVAVGVAARRRAAAMREITDVDCSRKERGAGSSDER
jgi:hypothetical protein